MKLKTLKDIPMEQDKPYVYDSKGNNNFNEIEKDFRVSFNWKKAIRQEAIKWINYLEKQKPKDKKNIHWAFCNEQQKWIKHFFNLIEEEIGK